MEIVDHELPAVEAISSAEELVFQRPSVDEDSITVAVSGSAECGTSPPDERFDRRLEGGLKPGKQLTEEAAVLDSCRGRERHVRHGGLAGGGFARPLTAAGDRRSPTDAQQLDVSPSMHVGETLNGYDMVSAKPKYRTLWPA
jgi:hypothetical protein